MMHPLRKHIEEIISLTDEEFEFVLGHFEKISKRKMQNRIAAQKSRERKKNYLTNLEQENLYIKKKYNELHSEYSKLFYERNEVKEKLNSNLCSNCRRFLNNNAPSISFSNKFLV